MDIAFKPKKKRSSEKGHTTVTLSLDVYEIVVKLANEKGATIKSAAEVLIVKGDEALKEK